MQSIHRSDFPLISGPSTETWASKLQMIQGEEDFPWSGTESSVTRHSVLGACSCVHVCGCGYANDISAIREKAKGKFYQTMNKHLNTLSRQSALWEPSHDILYRSLFTTTTTTYSVATFHYSLLQISEVMLTNPSVVRPLSAQLKPIFPLLPKFLFLLSPLILRYM